MMYYEDIEPGRKATFGPLAVSADEIVDFAKKYDPQRFHLSDEGARDTFFGSLAASGWHTAAMTMKLIVAFRAEPLASLGSPGFDDLHWHQPVYPGDELHARTQVLDKWLSESCDDRGIVRLYIETLNQRDDVVMSVTSMVFMARRPAD